MTPTSSEWIDSIVRILTGRGYAIGRSPVGSAFLATKRVRSFGPFLPCTDFVFIRDCSTEIAAENFKLLHEQARAFTNSQFHLPKALRYHIPNTVSVGVSENGFPEAVVGFVKESKLRSPLVGGEKDSTYLFDIAGRELLSQGVEITPARYGARVVSPVNPTNRTYELMIEILRQLLSE